jgi:hypothetical protein
VQEDLTVAAQACLAYLLIAIRLPRARILDGPQGRLLGALAIFTVYFVVMLWAAIARKRAAGSGRRAHARAAGDRLSSRISFDTLGIGSMATTTAICTPFQSPARRAEPERRNAGHALPVIAQAFIYTRLVQGTRRRS